METPILLSMQESRYFPLADIDPANPAASWCTRCVHRISIRPTHVCGIVAVDGKCSYCSSTGWDCLSMG
ncbi:hypothetical protein N7495_000119 [Penicillium taxi]|uniref:uncharacterized protein n=1 Tax=Penicillium taxi TaxID=168475 RepID=UPI002544D666|nr:uncharacterized protein N7495_000119 [Penicillium taxi]KAJ5907437.1 hypothetical protein N7495_000119 [Penicillium taxi]